MPRALVLGGSGYLGLAVSQSLLRTGNYTVYGTARSAEKAQTLRQNEITPIEAEIVNPVTLAKIIADNRIDTVIDSTSAYEQASAILSGVITAAKERASVLSKDNVVGPKLGFIYTSGSWVHGDVPERISDLTPPNSALALDKPATAVGWRPAHEQAILAARDVLSVAILRPCAIYGRGSWVWSVWWGGLLAAANSGSTDAVAVPAIATARTATAHVDDLAEAYVNAADRIDGNLGEWPVFDLYGETASVTEIIEKAKVVLGVKAPINYSGTQGNPFFEALSCTNNSDTGRARSVLGWAPRHRNFIETLPQTLAAWKSVQK